MIQFLHLTPPPPSSPSASRESTSPTPNDVSDTPTMPHVHHPPSCVHPPESPRQPLDEPTHSTSPRASSPSIQQPNHPYSHQWLVERRVANQPLWMTHHQRFKIVRQPMTHHHAVLQQTHHLVLRLYLKANKQQYLTKTHHIRSLQIARTNPRVFGAIIHHLRLRFHKRIVQHLHIKPTNNTHISIIIHNRYTCQRRFLPRTNTHHLTIQTNHWGIPLASLPIRIQQIFKTLLA